MGTLNTIMSVSGDTGTQSGGQVMSNRTGATTSAGSVGFQDTLQTDTGGGGDTSLLAAMANVVAATTAYIKLGRVGVWAEAGVADDGTGKFIMGEGVICKIRVDGGTDIVKGDALIAVNGANYLAKTTTASARYHAIALEAETNAVDVSTWRPILCILYSEGRTLGL